MALPKALQNKGVMAYIRNSYLMAPPNNLVDFWKRRKQVRRAKYKARRLQLKYFDEHLRSLLATNRFTSRYHMTYGSFKKLVNNQNSTSPPHHISRQTQTHTTHAITPSSHVKRHKVCIEGHSSNKTAQMPIILSLLQALAPSTTTQSTINNPDTCNPHWTEIALLL